MLHISHLDLQDMASRYRANLINSCTGYKSCNLLGTASASGQGNLAIFNSVIHMGSNPALLGFVLRPLTVKRHTYDNFKETGYFTVNQVHSEIMGKAHHTAAKYPEGVSEFSKAGLTEAYLDDFKAPYVKESHIKLGCAYVNEYLLAENGCLLIIGAIKHIYLPKEVLHPDGWVQLDKAHTVATNGLDGYALPHLMERFAYPQPDQATQSLDHGA